jgi:hypothetical protein
VRETEILVEQQPLQGVFVYGHAGPVINKFLSSWFYGFGSGGVVGGADAASRNPSRTINVFVCDHAGLVINRFSRLTGLVQAGVSGELMRERAMVVVPLCVVRELDGVCM